MRRAIPGRLLQNIATISARRSAGTRGGGICGHVDEPKIVYGVGVRKRGRGGGCHRRKRLTSQVERGGDWKGGNLPPGKVSNVLPALIYSRRALMSSPSALCTAPKASETASTLPPCSSNISAAHDLPDNLPLKMDVLHCCVPSISMISGLSLRNPGPKVGN